MRNLQTDVFIIDFLAFWRNNLFLSEYMSCAIKELKVIENVWQILLLDAFLVWRSYVIDYRVKLVLSDVFLIALKDFCYLGVSVVK